MQTVLFIIIGVAGCICETFVCYAGLRWWRNHRSQKKKPPQRPYYNDNIICCCPHSNSNRHRQIPSHSRCDQILLAETEGKATNCAKPGKTVDNLQNVHDNNGLNLNDEMIDVGRDLINYGSFNVNIASKQEQ